MASRLMIVLAVRTDSWYTIGRPGSRISGMQIIWIIYCSYLVVSTEIEGGRYEPHLLYDGTLWIGAASEERLFSGMEREAFNLM
jgi:hypothetical protein